MTYGCGCDVEDNCSCTPCDKGECDHKGHCEVCDQGFDYPCPDGWCKVCELEYQSQHLLMDKPKVERARFITNGVYHDFYSCPNCDGEMPVLPGEETATCPDCEKKWRINFDYSFDDGSWRDCSTISLLMEGAR